MIEREVLPSKSLQASGEMTKYVETTLKAECTECYKRGSKQVLWKLENVVGE